MPKRRYPYRPRVPVAPTGPLVGTCCYCDAPIPDKQIVCHEHWLRLSPETRREVSPICKKWVTEEVEGAREMVRAILVSLEP